MGWDLQVSGILGEVAWDAGQLLVGAVHNGALAAALLRAHEVHEALTAESVAIILRAYVGPKRGLSSSFVFPGTGLMLSRLEVGSEVAG